MKKTLMLLAALLSSYTAFADFKPVGQPDNLILVKKVQQGLMKKFEHHRPQNCMMPYDHGFGVLFEREGQLHSREFFFTSNEGHLLNLPAYYDAGLNAIMLQQSGSLGQAQYSLITNFDNDGAVGDVELKFNYNSDNVSVKCGQR